MEATACRTHTTLPHNAGSRFQSVRPRRWRVVCGARPESPYEPLEKAVRVINRVIALGERAKWGAEDDKGSSSGGSGSGSAGGDKPAQERWVQFGAVYNSSIMVEQGAPAAAAAGPSGGEAGQQAVEHDSAGSAAAGLASSAQPGSELTVNGSTAKPSSSSSGIDEIHGSSSSSGSSASVAAVGSSGGGDGGSSRLLQDYLALPIEQYSLLDPKWISREEGGMFRFSLPLQDLVGVDLQPEIYISVLPEPQQRQVTLAGTRAALGSPEIDEAFKLNVTAVLSQRQRRRLPALPRPPPHLPGRPVYRLRRWAAAARGRTWPPEENTNRAAAGAAKGSGSSSSSKSSSTDVLLTAAGAQQAAAVAAAAAESAPFPSQHVYISHDENDDDEYMGPDDLAAAELAVAELEVAELDDQADATKASSSGGGGGSSGSQVLTGAAFKAEQTGSGSGSSHVTEQQQQQQQGPAVLRRQEALLHCRTHVTMAVRVPRALQVVPNALLGYAGSLLLRTILTATLPNFLELLATDYRRWAGIDASSSGSYGRQVDAPVGDLFSDAVAVVAEGRQRRQQEARQQ